ncbi:MAG: DUF2752 domain-containing protein [Leptospira sp.]|nr:DUF2752 domain-containing protein [Leptospira sp.]
MIKILSFCRVNIFLVGFPIALFLIYISSFVFRDNLYNYVHVTICPFKNATGIDCPGCGMGRSILALFNGDLEHSLKFHRFGIIVVFVSIIYYVFLLLKLRGMEKLSETKSLTFRLCLYLFIFFFSANYMIKLYLTGSTELSRQFQGGLIYRFLHINSK